MLLHPTVEAVLVPELGCKTWGLGVLLGVEGSAFASPKLLSGQGNGIIEFMLQIFSIFFIQALIIITAHRGCSGLQSEGLAGNALSTCQSVISTLLGDVHGNDLAEDVLGRHRPVVSPALDGGHVVVLKGQYGFDELPAQPLLINSSVSQI